MLPRTEVRSFSLGGCLPKPNHNLIPWNNGNISPLLQQQGAASLLCCREAAVAVQWPIGCPPPPRVRGGRARRRNAAQPSGGCCRRPGAGPCSGAAPPARGGWRGQAGEPRWRVAARGGVLESKCHTVTS